MRRKDREVADPVRIREILTSCTCCRLGFYDGEEVYIVPLSYGFREREGEYTLYFHGAAEGRKLDLLQHNPMVGFELDEDCGVRTAPMACGHSAAYRSIIGTGTLELLTERRAREEALRCIMSHYTGREDWDFPAERMEGLAVFCLHVRKLSCKEHV